jgi:hypothetical protein
MFIKYRSRIFKYLVFFSITITCIISSSEPSYTLFGQIYKEGNLERAREYEYPILIDQLPKGTVIWNIGAPNIMNFLLAGNHLTNKVIPAKWLGQQTLREFINLAGIDYIVEVDPFCFKDAKKTGAKLVFEGKIKRGNTRANTWRIWKVGRMP